MVKRRKKEENWMLCKHVKRSSNLLLLKVLSHVQFFVTLDYSLPGSSVHGISQAGILEWVAISFSRASSRPRDRTHVSCVSCIAGGLFTAVIRVVKVKTTMRNDLPCLTHRAGKKQKESQAQNFVGWQRKKNSPTHCQWRNRWEEAGDKH